MSFRLDPRGYRPETGVVPSTIYVETTGSDEGNGTLAQPFATLARAYQAVPVTNAGNITIQLGTGTFAAPLVQTGLNYITVKGTVSVLSTATISGPPVFAANDEGVVVDVTGLSVTADQLRGRFIRFTSGPANGLWGVIGRNDATGATTRLYLTQEPPPANLNSSIVAPLNGNTLEVLTLDTTLQLQGQATLECSTQANFQELNLTGVAAGNVLFVVGTDKPSFYRVAMSGFRRIQAGTAGRVHLDCCSVATGGLSDLGMLAAVNGGTLLIQRGTAILGHNAAVNSDFIAAIQGGNLAFRNFIYFRDMTDAIRIQGGGMYGDAGIGAEDVLFFEDNSGAGASNAGAAIRINPGGFAASGLDGNYITQNLEGSVTGNYALTARLGAKVIIAGQIAAALGVRAVSSDNGTTQRAISKDGTVIAGGVPTRSEDFGEHDVVNISGPTTVSVQPFDINICNTTGGNITLTLSSAPALGDLIIVKLKLGAGTVTLNGNGNTLEVPTVPGTFAASVVLGTLGTAVYYIWDGTNWVVK